MADFDYIIIGAGSAGCVLANRLSAAPGTRVCLLEAGPPDSSPLIDTPLGFLGLLASKKYNWRYTTAPQENLHGRTLYWPRGKTLGGSSAINAMIYIRGAMADYDEWQANGAPGWNGTEMLSAFRALEANERGTDDYHGAGNALNVADLRTPHLLSALFVQAAIQAGLPPNPDFNGATQLGTGLYQVTQKNGRRHSAARAFLDPVKSRPNLTIQTHAHVTKILLTALRATGVEVKTPQGLTRISAAREVILAGGAINSPQLLLLSGIGPPAELARHNIAPLHNLPGVGQNLQDHLNISLIARDTSKRAFGFGFKTPFVLLKALAEYRKSATGLFTSNVAEAGGFAALTPASTRPEIQLHFLPTAIRDHTQKLYWGYGITLRCCQLRPKSRGHIALHSADPLAPPLIQPNYLAHDDDMAELLAGFKLGRRILNTKIMRDAGLQTLAPDENFSLDAQLCEFIRNYAQTIYHPVGTCKMGEDNLAVVDARLRVHGIAGLRVADASIMPSLISGNTNATCLALAAKAAGMILQDAQTTPPP